MKKRVVLMLAVTLLGSVAPLFAEDSGASLVREIEIVRAALAKQNTSAQEKHDNYVRLGRLLNLSGDIEGAAGAWLAAAYAESGKRDDTALLESAACFMAMGEWDKADANVKLCLLTVRDKQQIFLKARYLAAQIEAFKNGNDTILFALTDDPAYRSARPALYLTLWKLCGKEEFMMKLLTEYPESPEARAMLAEKAGRNYVTDAAASHWFLYPGRESVVITESGARAAVNAPEGALEAGVSPALQTGIFNSKDNALAQAAVLKKAGFSAEVVRRLSGGAEHWAVTVRPGANMNQTIIALKDAGYEVFPVY
jgi:hypothetical protein